MQASLIGSFNKLAFQMHTIYHFCIMKVTDVLEVFANEITDSASQVTENFKEIINNPEFIKKQLKSK